MFCTYLQVSLREHAYDIIVKFGVNLTIHYFAMTVDCIKQEIVHVLHVHDTAV